MITEKIKTKWSFLLAVLIFYIVLFFVSRDSFYEVMSFLWKILGNILPILVVVFLLMGLMNYFISREFIIKHLRGHSLKSWIFAIVTGILSAGPIYMWYPLLREAMKKGVSEGLIACFLYNRAIKIPLLPMIIFYFDWKYVLILLTVMVFMSVVQGIIIRRLVK